MTRKEMFDATENLIQSWLFGVEIEFTGITRKNSALIVCDVLQKVFPDDEVYAEKEYEKANDIYKIYREVEGIKTLYFSVVHDGSVAPYKLSEGGYSLCSGKNVFKCELTTKKMTLEEIDLLVAVVDALKVGSKELNQRMVVGDTTSIHIHINGAELSLQAIKNFCNNIYSKQMLLYHATGQSPDSVRYQYMQMLPEIFVSKLKKVKTMIELRDCFYKSMMGQRANPSLEINKKYTKARYRLLSLCPLWDYRGYKSIEIRLFKSSTDSKVIVNYILFVLKLVAYCSLITKSTYRDLDAIDSERYSEKYRMHCFLNKIGCSGAKYKDVRRVFLENLEGQAAWRKEA